jgi:arsenate reductase (thioredoxin)
MAKDYVRCFGPEGPLSVHRQQLPQSDVRGTVPPSEARLKWQIVWSPRMHLNKFKFAFAYFIPQGFGRAIYPTATFYSAGTEPAAAVNPRATVVMAEKGIDISAHKPEHLIDDFTSKGVALTHVVTVCGGANEACPMFNRVEPYTETKIVHVGFEDPPALIDGLTDEEEILDVFRRVRNEIEVFIKDLPVRLPTLKFR